MSQQPDRSQTYAWFQEKPWQQSQNLLTSEFTTLRFPDSQTASRWKYVLNSNIEFNDSFDFENQYGRIEMFLGNRQVGYLSWSDGGYLKIDKIKILPPFRGIGYGSLLMAYFMDTIAENQEVSLDINDVGLIDFYEPFGFRVTRESDEDYPETEEECEAIIKDVEEKGGWLEMVRTLEESDVEYSDQYSDETSDYEEDDNIQETWIFEEGEDSESED